MAGRPSKYKEKYCEDLVRHMARGFSFESFCATIDVDRDTTYEWAKAHPEFSDAKKRGREKQLLFFEEMALDGARGTLEKFNSTAFVWASKNMVGWRDKSEVEHSGKLSLEDLVSQSHTEPE